MEFLDCRQLVIDTGRRMYEGGLTVGKWGNVSIRSQVSGHVFITPSGMGYDVCTPADINVYTVDGILVDGFRKPSVEKNLHLFIYKARPDICAIVHTHPLYSSVFGALGEDIPAITEEFAQVIGKVVRCARYFLPGTDELANAAVEALGDGPAALLASHGAVCAGEGVDAAFQVAEVLEKACQILYMARAIGKPKVISDEDVEAMYKFKRTEYGQ